MEKARSLEKSDHRAIIHIDADAFFVSCEQARNPRLKRKAVVTGRERRIVSALSYEAKALGVTRGMPLFQVEKKFPSVIILPSDYPYYSLISERMSEIVRRFSTRVEEYSIDECFAELSSAIKGYSAEHSARELKDALERELGITFSIGLAPTKVLAKVASKWQKPNGFTVIRERDMNRFLPSLPVEKIWGIGPRTAFFLNQHGILNALQFVERKETWIKEHLAKPFFEIWQELKCVNVFPILTHLPLPKSIQKAKTWVPASGDSRVVLAQFAKNIESACLRARDAHLISDRVWFFLTTRDFHHTAKEIRLPWATNNPADLISPARIALKMLMRDGTLYRQTGVTLTHLTLDRAYTSSLFPSEDTRQKMKDVFCSVDKINKKFGKHTLHLAPSLPAQKKNPLQREERKMFGIPFLSLNS